MIITMNDTTRNLILPLEFGLEIYSDYEQVFVRMKFRDNQDKKSGNSVRHSYYCYLIWIVQKVLIVHCLHR